MTHDDQMDMFKQILGVIKLHQKQLDMLFQVTNGLIVDVYAKKEIKSGLSELHKEAFEKALGYKIDDQFFGKHQNDGTE